MSEKKTLQMNCIFFHSFVERTNQIPTGEKIEFFFTYTFSQRNLIGYIQLIEWWNAITQSTYIEPTTEFFERKIFDVYGTKCFCCKRKKNSDSSATVNTNRRMMNIHGRCALYTETEAQVKFIHASCTVSYCHLWDKYKSGVQTSSAGR